MVVFKNHAQGEIFGLQGGGLGRRKREQNLISRSESIARFLWIVINQDAAVLDQSLNLITRKFQLHAAQKHVKP